MQKAGESPEHSICAVTAVYCMAQRELGYFGDAMPFEPSEENYSADGVGSSSLEKPDSLFKDGVDFEADVASIFKSASASDQSDSSHAHWLKAVLKAIPVGVIQDDATLDTITAAKFTLDNALTADMMQVFTEEYRSVTHDQDKQVWLRLVRNVGGVQSDDPWENPWLLADVNGYAAEAAGVGSVDGLPARAPVL
jgi:hypothetical protein